MVGSNIYRVREWTKCVCESICISFYCTSSLLQLETFKELVTRAMCIRDDSLNPPHDVSFHSIFVSFLRNLIARIFSLVTWNDLDSRTVCISRTKEDRTLYFFIALPCFSSQPKVTCGKLLLRINTPYGKYDGSTASQPTATCPKAYKLMTCSFHSM